MPAVLKGNLQINGTERRGRVINTPASYLVRPVQISARRPYIVTVLVNSSMQILGLYSKVGYGRVI
jgi:hypothetical protein